MRVTHGRARLVTVVATLLTAALPALAWAQSLSDPRSRDRALNSLDLDPQKLGPDAARNLVESIASESTRAEYARRVAERMASGGSIDEALAWAEGLNSATDRNRALQAVIHQWGAQDPADAAVYAAKLPQSPERDEAMNQALAHWVQADPDGAFAFGQALPEGRDRDNAMARAVD